MKRKIVWFLCDRGFYRLALKISPSYVKMWRNIKLWKATKESVEKLAATVTELQIALKKANYELEIKIGERKIEK